MQPVKVLYVLGRGRSGSTIFANVLGECSGFFSAGEVRYLWDPILKDGGECGSGEPLGICRVWSCVLKSLAGVDAQTAARLQRAVVREQNLPRLLARPPGESRGWDDLARFAGVMSRVYAELARVTGARVIVDSSKRPSYAAFLRHVPGVDLYLVHMVRDPRASAYSWKHRKHKSVQGGREVTRRGAVDATARWVLLNWGAQRVMRRHGGSRSLTLRYEDFVARPRPCVKTVLSLVGEVPGHLPFAGDHTVRLSPNHTLSGNPSRYAAGTVHLRDNGEWKTAQSRLDAALATAVAAPYLRRYGYGVRV